MTPLADGMRYLLSVLQLGNEPWPDDCKTSTCICDPALACVGRCKSSQNALWDMHYLQGSKQLSSAVAQCRLGACTCRSACEAMELVSPICCACNEVVGVSLAHASSSSWHSFRRQTTAFQSYQSYHCACCRLMINCSSNDLDTKTVASCTSHDMTARSVRAATADNDSGPLGCSRVP